MLGLAIFTNALSSQLFHRGKRIAGTHVVAILLLVPTSQDMWFQPEKVMGWQDMSHPHSHPGAEKQLWAQHGFP